MSQYAVDGRRLGFIEYLSILVFIVFVAATAFIFVQNARAQSENDAIKKELQTVNAQIDDLNKKNIQKLAATYKFLQSVKDNEIKWSRIIDHLEALTPEGVHFNSYVGTEGKDISITVEAETIGLVIDTINKFTGSSSLDEVFVPSVNKGVTSQGDKLYSFTLNTSLK